MAEVGAFDMKLAEEGGEAARLLRSSCPGGQEREGAGGGSRAGPRDRARHVGRAQRLLAVEVGSDPGARRETAARAKAEALGWASPARGRSGPSPPAAPPLLEQRPPRSAPAGGGGGGGTDGGQAGGGVRWWWWWLKEVARGGGGGVARLDLHQQLSFADERGLVHLAVREIVLRRAADLAARLRARRGSRCAPAESPGSVRRGRRCARRPCRAQSRRSAWPTGDLALDHPRVDARAPLAKLLGQFQSNAPTAAAAAASASSVESIVKLACSAVISRSRWSVRGPQSPFARAAAASPACAPAPTPAAAGSHTLSAAARPCSRS